jgi:hypothetical protein
MNSPFISHSDLSYLTLLQTTKPAQRKVLLLQTGWKPRCPEVGSQCILQKFGNLG